MDKSYLTEVNCRINGFSLDTWMNQSYRMNNATHKVSTFGLKGHTPQDMFRIATEEYMGCIEMLSYLKERSDDTESFEDFWTNIMELWIVHLDKWSTHEQNRI